MSIAFLLLSAFPGSHPPPATPGVEALRARSVSLHAGDEDVLVRATQGRPQDGLRLRLASVGRGVGPASAPAVTRRRLEDGRLCFERGWLEERYELCGAGVEQSFVLDALPPGEGDLVVSMHVETSLELLTAERDTLSFGRTGEPHDAVRGLRVPLITIAGIVGIDGGGARVAGSMAWSPGLLELRIPAAFVRSARLPLVVDPLITGEVRLATFSRAPSRSPDVSVAYLADADRYFAAWTTQEGAKGGSDTPQGRLVAGDGSPVGNAIFLNTQATYASDARVASLRAARRFVVTSVGAVFGGQNPWLTAVDESGAFVDVQRLSFLDVGSIDVGGEAAPQGDTALVACTSLSGSVVLYRVDGTTLGVLETLTLTPSGSGDREIAISATGGASGRYLVTWTRVTGAQEDVWAAVVDRDGVVLVAPFPVADSGAGERDPDVDGDGTHWVVAYELGSGNDHDIACREVTYVAASGSASVSDEHVVEGDVGQEERDPAVAWMGESTLIGWSEQFSGADYDVYLKSVESFGCLDCEGESLVANPSTPDEGLALASKRSAGGTGPEALVAWMRTTLLVEPPVYRGSSHVRVFRAEDGALIDLGGGCGAGGVARATCAATGAASFGLAIDDALPLELCGLLLGLDRLDLVCGPCTLVLDPLWAQLTTTDAAGRASLTFPLPGAVSFPGARFLAQWFVRSPSGCGNFSFSNALEVIVE